MRLVQLFEQVGTNHIDLENYESEARGMSDQEREDFVIKLLGGRITYIKHIKNPSEKVQMYVVGRDGFYLRDMIRKVVPSEEVQLKAISTYPEAIWILINNGIPISDNIKQLVMMSPLYGSREREELVKDLYPNNELMQRKWLRYRV